jgi:hypothetical protein
MYNFDEATIQKFKLLLMKAHEWFYVASLRITVVSTLLVSLAHAPIKTTETVTNRIMSTL